MSNALPLAALALAAALLPACTDSGSGDGDGDGRATPSPTGGASSGAVSHAATVRFTVADASRADATAAVLRLRLDALGMAPGEPAVAGTTVTFGVSRTPTAEEKAALARRGRLLFRPVTEELPPAGKATGAPEGDCSDAAYRERLAERYADGAAAGAVACQADGTAKYVLGAAEATNVTNARAESAGDATGATQWTVAVELGDASAWEALTEKYVGKQLAIVLDGIVQTAPTINEPIPDGSAVLSGSFTEASAKALAAVLRSGPIETGVTVS